jgi:ribonuclease HII
LAARRRVLLRLERALWAQGITRVCGVDEVGVGPLAGPLVAAAVVLPREIDLRGVDDSKKLSARARTTLAAQIRADAVDWAIGIVSAAEVDRLNPYRGALEAMRRAVVQLAVPPEEILVDARTIPGVAAPQQSLVKGDARSYSIAAASIVAKDHRDDLMRKFDAMYPEYGFGRHMGYGTRAHLEALDRFGPCPEHRRSFAPVRQLRLSIVV